MSVAAKPRRRQNLTWDDVSSTRNLDEDIQLAADGAEAVARETNIHDTLGMDLL